MFPTQTRATLPRNITSAQPQRVNLGVLWGRMGFRTSRGYNVDSSRSPVPGGPTVKAVTGWLKSCRRRFDKKPTAKEKETPKGTDSPAFFRLGDKSSQARGRPAKLPLNRRGKGSPAGNSEFHTTFLWAARFKGWRRKKSPKIAPGGNGRLEAPTWVSLRHPSRELDASVPTPERPAGAASAPPSTPVPAGSRPSRARPELPVRRRPRPPCRPALSPSRGRACPARA